MNKKDKAVEYAQMRYGCNNGNRETGNEIAKVIACRVGFEAGWDEALKSQWISTKKRMPEQNVDVIFLTDFGMIMNGQCHDNVWMQMDGFFGSAYSSIEKTWEVIAWMPIPSFDNILENNKDVLKRLKEK